MDLQIDRNRFSLIHTGTPRHSLISTQREIMLSENWKVMVAKGKEEKETFM